MSAGARESIGIPEKGFVAVASVNDPNRAGYPLHAFDSDGNHVRAFGAVNPTVRAGDPYLNARRIANGHGSNIWSARHAGKYELERWSLDGTLQEVLVRDAYPPYDLYWLPTPAKPPAPLISSLRQDRSGLLWVSVWVADSNWNAGIAEQVVGRTTRYKWTDLQLIHDTRIEVIDPRSRTLRAFVRLPGTFDFFVDDGLLAAVREDETGVLRIELWQATYLQR
jgi:hypothetical protein